MFFFGIAISRISKEKIKKDSEHWSLLDKKIIRRLFHFEKFLETMKLNGNIVECGVSEGKTIAFFAKLQEAKND